MASRYTTTVRRPPSEPAHPRDDDRVTIPAGPGDGSGSTLDSLRDSQVPRYAGLFDQSGSQMQEFSSPEMKSVVGVDYTGPATSFYMSDTWDASGTRSEWKRKKALHHDSNYDYTGSDRSSSLAKYRSDFAYCQAIVQSLEVPAEWQSWIVSRTLRGETRPFNRHYGGYFGATLAHAVLCIADDSEEFLRTDWFAQLESVVDEWDATFEVEALVEFAFRFQENQ